METSQAYYITKMKESLSLKQRGNPNYSLRAFARDVGIHHGTLGQVLKGTRPLPYKDSHTVVEKLKLSPKEKTLFMESLLRKKLSIDSIKIDELDQRFMLDESYYKVIAEWEHTAVLDLFQVKNFNGTIEQITKKLKIAPNRAEVVLNNLMTCGLLIQDESGNFKTAHPDFRTTEDITNQAIKDSHIETMQMGIEKINSVPVEKRDFSSSSFAIDVEQIPEAKTIIREFRQKMTALLKNGKNKTEVFQLAVQFYPLTELDYDTELQ